jgi:hypothetical protein
MSFKVLARFGAGRSGDDSDSSLIAKFLDERTVETSLVQIPGQCFSFMLDRVFTPNETNKDVHGVCTMPAVQQLMAGQNAAVLLYGHGGSGKLDTAFGTKSMAGLLSMTIEAISSRRRCATSLPNRAQRQGRLCAYETQTPTQLSKARLRWFCTGPVRRAR